MPPRQVAVQVAELQQLHDHPHVLAHKGEPVKRDDVAVAAGPRKMGGGQLSGWEPLVVFDPPVAVIFDSLPQDGELALQGLAVLVAHRPLEHLSILLSRVGS